MIWQFDKLKAEWKCLPIGQVAQAPKFYEQEVEIELNEKVEKPANHVIDRIRRDEPIDDDDRMHMTYYLGTMIRRVPHHRKKAEAVMPAAIADALENEREKLRQAAAEARISITAMASQIRQIDMIEKKFLDNPPEQVRNVVKRPWPFESMLVLIRTMTWRIVRTTGNSSFLISDNPAFFFEEFPLGNQKCELILPISSRHLLHCSWQPAAELYVDDKKEKLVEEFNRRIVKGTQRCIFCHEQAAWGEKLAIGESEPLSLIRWG